MRVLFLILVVLTFASCEKTPPCEKCLCFSFPEMLRLVFHDELDNNLLDDGSLTIDSVKGIKLIYNSDKPDIAPYFSELIDLEYTVKDWTISPDISDGENFFDISPNHFIHPSIKDGLDMDHDFYIYLSNGEMGTITVRYQEISESVGDCCSCSAYKNVYLKYDGQTLTEATSFGAAIVRK